MRVSPREELPATRGDFGCQPCMARQDSREYPMRCSRFTRVARGTTSDATVERRDLVPLLGAALAGAAVAVILGVYGRRHAPAGQALFILGFSGSRCSPCGRAACRVGPCRSSAGSCSRCSSGCGSRARCGSSTTPASRASDDGRPRPRRPGRAGDRGCHDRGVRHLAVHERAAEAGRGGPRPGPIPVRRSFRHAARRVTAATAGAGSGRRSRASSPSDIPTSPIR
jgi:Family of unknown function (DUF6529)